MSSRFKKALLTLAAVAAVIFIAEGLLRISTPDTFLQSGAGSTVWPWVVTDPVLGWENSAGFESSNFIINSFGMRGGEIELNKPKGVKRIACIGDSGTFGVWFGERASRNWDSYPEYLSRLLKENGYQNIEVINAGVVGYASSHTLRKLMTKVLKLEPDIIVLRVGFNDTADMGADFFRDYYVKEPAGPVTRWFIYNFPESRVVRLLAWVGRKIDGWMVSGERNFVTEDEFRANIERMVKAARERGIEIIFIDYPLRDKESGLHRQELYLTKYYGVNSLAEFHEKHGAYQDILSEVARTNGVNVVDTQLIFENSSNPVHSEQDFVHLNKLGARLTALSVYETMLELGWLK